ncbi:MAG TPA: hypothetical protein VIU34_28390 [Steroidobacter sp.]
MRAGFNIVIVSFTEGRYHIFAAEVDNRIDVTRLLSGQDAAHGIELRLFEPAAVEPLTADELTSCGRRLGRKPGEQRRDPREERSPRHDFTCHIPVNA